MGFGRVVVLTGWLTILGALGCAPTQVVSLSLEPVPMGVYVDGELLDEGSPREVQLRTDRPHVLFFKRDGYRSQQIVLESDSSGGAGPRLSPDRVEIRLEPIETRGRQLEVELEPREDDAKQPAERDRETDQRMESEKR